MSEILQHHKKIDFIQMLESMAKMRRIDIPEIMLTWYDDELKQYGYDNLLRAGKKLFMDKAMRGFPDIQDFKEALGIPKELTDEEKAKDAASRIIEGVSRYGWPNPDKAESYIGEIGWFIVNQQGGWQEVCRSLTENNKTSFQAQWRDLAVVLIKKAKSGNLYLAPSFDSNDNKSLPKTINDALEVVGDFTKMQKT